MPTNSWIDQRNAYVAQVNNTPPTYYGAGGMYVPQKLQQAETPSDFAAFRQNFGGGYATEADYNNWRNGQQRTNTLSDFVNQMSSANPDAQANTERTQADAAKYGGNVDAYLASSSPTMGTNNAFGSAPTMGTSNRFEGGLSDAETRLRSLLDNPDSIKQSAAYKFRVGQGEEALQRSLGAKGLLNSGNRLMELTKYGQDMGSQEYEAQAGRLSSLLSTYGQGYLGDRSANTAEFGARANAWAAGDRANTDRFTAESNAWTQRGGLLRDLYGGASTAANQSVATQGNDRVGFANVWVNQAPKAEKEYAMKYGGGSSGQVPQAFEMKPGAYYGF